MKDTLRFITALQAAVAPPPAPEKPLDPAFTASVKQPRRTRRKRQSEPKAERGWDGPA